MKRVLSLTLAASLLALSMGPSAASASAQTIAAAVKVQAPVGTTPVLPAMNLGLQNTQSLNSPSLAAPAASVVGLPSVVVAAPVEIGPAAAALPVAAPAAVSPLFQAAFVTPEGEATPFAQSLQALAAPAPEYKDMDSGASKESAEKDFNNRIGVETPVIGTGAQDPTAEIELLVSAPDGSGRRMTQDVYPASLQAQSVSPLDVDLAMNAQLMNLGVSPDMLKIYGAKAVGAVAQINTAVVKVSALDAGLLVSELQNLGLKVQVGRVFKLPKPMDSAPDAKGVTLKEMVKVIKADGLQAELTKVLGAPAAPGKKSFLGRMVSAVKSALFGTAENPVLPWALLDSWAFVDHPYMKGRFTKSVANDDDGESHGTHTASTVVGVDRWNHDGRNYNIFPNGSATEGDILFKLNMAVQDGALATTNSWGDGSGNPEGAIEKLFVKTSEAGTHHSISAGNSGYYGKNSIGGPAIAVSDHDLVINGNKIGTVKRIKAIAASDANKRTASFSSRGPGSRTTAGNPDQYKDYPQKPDESGVGVDLIAAVPKGSHNAELGGPGAAMSGTSMSNPGVFGGFMLLTRGILVLAKDLLPVLPAAQLTQFAMDLARYTMTQTAEKVAGPDEVGDGFINIQAAYDLAVKLLKDNAPAPTRWTVRFHNLMRGVFGSAPLA
ncbi:MAG: S8 family serine peptidase [Elusimicrobia bacterium]|nr:S8 family serine peptidase [Elusimicrobiota bacterium]